MHPGVRTTAFASALIALLLPVLASATDSSELHITPRGTLSATNLTLLQKSGNNLFARAYWGNAFIRVTVLVGTSTVIAKNHGEKTTVVGGREGQPLDVEGTVASGSDSLIVNASGIRVLSLVTESKTLAGKVQSINPSALSFVLPNSKFGSTTVVAPASVPITKGARTIEFGDIAAGDKVLSVSGTYDYSNNTLMARSLEVFQDKTMFTPRNFQGALKSISGTTLPVTAVILVGGTDYTVYRSDIKSTFPSGTHVPEMLEQSRVKSGVIVDTLMLKDSNDLTEADRESILERCKTVPEQRVVIKIGRAH